MAASQSQLRAVLKGALEEILLPEEEWTIFDGKMHASLGADYQCAAVAPEEDRVHPGNQMVLHPVAFVQVFLRWEKVVDNQRVVDPAPIETLADQFRDALQSRQDPGVDDLWFFKVERLWYPDDPTGQKTRFHAFVQGDADNNSVLLRESGP